MTEEKFSIIQIGLAPWDLLTLLSQSLLKYEHQEHTPGIIWQFLEPEQKFFGDGILRNFCLGLI